MTRPIRGNPADAATIHALKSDDGAHELHAGDISLGPGADALTLATSIEAWLEAMQRQINTLAGSVQLLSPQLAGIWEEQPQNRVDRRWFQPDTEANKL